MRYRVNVNYFAIFFLPPFFIFIVGCNSVFVRALACTHNEALKTRNTILTDKHIPFD